MSINETPNDDAPISGSSISELELPTQYDLFKINKKLIACIAIVVSAIALSGIGITATYLLQQSPVFFWAAWLIAMIVFNGVFLINLKFAPYWEVHRNKKSFIIRSGLKTKTEFYSSITGFKIVEDLKPGTNSVGTDLWVLVTTKDSKISSQVVRKSDGSFDSSADVENWFVLREMIEGSSLREENGLTKDEALAIIDGIIKNSNYHYFL